MLYASVNQFRSNLQNSEHDDEQETLYILQDPTLMQQIEESMKTHKKIENCWLNTERMIAVLDDIAEIEDLDGFDAAELDHESCEDRP